MINAQPGYWDVDRCSWVGTDPVYVVPPLRHADHPHDRVPGGAPELPEPRSAADEEQTIELEPGAATTA
jgi:hypothetical protein